MTPDSITPLVLAVGCLCFALWRRASRRSEAYVIANEEQARRIQAPRRVQPWATVALGGGVLLICIGFVAAVYFALVWVTYFFGGAQ